MKKTGLLIACIVIVALITSGLTMRQNQPKKITNPYVTLKYDKVIAYDYDGRGGQKIVKKDALNNIRMKKSVQLTKSQITKLHKLIGDPKTYGGGTAACFDPRMGIVYYLNEQIVGHISVCLECNYLESSHKIPATETKKQKLDETDFYYLRGFSKKARLQFKSFCRELKFSSCDTYSELFDQ